MLNNIESSIVGEEVPDGTPEEAVTDSSGNSSEEEFNEIMASVDENAEQENANSPKPQYALCKYRWSKTIPTDATDVLFYSSVNQNEPVSLVWVENQSAYYSEEKRILCGNFTGDVSVDGRQIPVEEFSVRSYTFEVDLFTRDDVIEDIVGVDEIEEAEKNLQQQSSTSKNIDTYNDINSSLSSLNKFDSAETSGKLTNKYEDLVRQQINFSDQEISSQENIQTMSNHSSERATPTSNGHVLEADRIVNSPPNMDVIDDVLTVQDLQQSNALASDHSAHSSARQSPYKLSDESNHNLTRIPPEQDHPMNSYDRTSQTGSQRNSLTQSPVDNAVDEMFGIQTAPLSHTSSRHSSARQTPQKQMDSVSSPARSSHGSARQTPVSVQGSDRHTPILSPARSGQSSSRQTPQLDQAEVIDDVLGATTPDSIHSDKVPMSITPTREKISDNFVPSDEKLYGSQELRYGGSQSSKQSSRSTSVTSAHELNDSRQDIHRTPVSGSGRSSSARSNSSSSLHNVSNLRGEDTDFRTRTPENHIRLPNGPSPARSPMGSNRSTPMSNTSSRASNRTLTPIVNQGGHMENGFKEGDHRIEDLEVSVSNLRKLLCNRETEVNELQTALRDSKDVIRSLRDEIDRAHNRESPASGESSKLMHWEKKYCEIQGEKEVLSAEVVKLRDELEDVYRMQEEGNGSPGIRRYSPNNPYALQRKVAELESHIQDLHEANESSTNGLGKAEKRIRQLQEENERLASCSNLDNSELMKKCTRLQERIDKMYKQESMGESDFHRRAEWEQLRDEHHTLRDKNVALHEENIRLREDLANMRHSTAKPSHLSRGYGDHDSHSDALTTEESATERDLGHEHNKPYSDISATRTYLSKYEALKEKSSSLTNPRMDYGSLDRHSLTRDRHYDKLDYNYSDSLLKDSRSLHKNRDYSSLDRLHQERSKPDGAPVTDKSNTELPYEKYSSLTRTDPLSSGLRRSKSEKDMIEREYLEALKYDKMRNEGELKGLSSLHYPEPPRPSQRSVDKYQEKLTGDADKRFDNFKKISDVSSARKLFSMRKALSVSSLKGDNTPTEHRHGWTDTEDDHSDVKLTDGYHSEGEATYRSRIRTSTYDNKYIGRDESLPHSTLLPSSRSQSYSPLRLDLKSESYKPISYLSRSKSTTNSPRTRLVYGGEDKYNTTTMKDPDRYLKSYSSDTRKSHIMNRSFEEKYSSLDRRAADKISSHYGDELRKKSYMEDNGEFSDTATDILVSTEAYNRALSKPRVRKSHKRQNSGGSVGSVSSLSDVEDDYSPSMLRQRSKSADGRVRHNHGISGLTQTKAEKSTKLSLTSGFRSIAPRPIPTQHNKNAIEPSSIMSRSLTQGLRPFAPRSHTDVKIGDVVKFSRQGGKLSQGFIKYIGHLPGRSDIYLGVELDKEDGKHDGSFETRRYFTCKPNKGVFVAFNKIVMAWTPYSG